LPANAPDDISAKAENNAIKILFLDMKITTTV
jgi:hypothetical protein